MLELIIIGVLFCVGTIEAIVIQRNLRQIRYLRKAVASWKLAAEHWEKEAHKW